MQEAAAEQLTDVYDQRYNPIRVMAEVVLR